MSSSEIQGPQILHVSDESEEMRNKGGELELVRTTQSSLVEYRVYSVRWAGLAVLMSMNLVISWGVGSHNNPNWQAILNYDTRD